MLIEKATIFFLLLLASIGVLGQDRHSSISIKGPNTISLGGNIVKILNDTTINLPDTLELIFLKENNLIKFENRPKLNGVVANQLRAWLFAGMPDTNQIDFNRREFLSKYDGRIVRKIKIFNVDVFGASVEYPDKDSANNLLERTGNRIHRNTSKTLIRRSLNIRQGDRIAPSELVEKEVIIRSLPYIQDVRITPIEVANTDSVDLQVRVQDVWSIGFHIEPYSANRGFFEVFEENAFGQGQEILLRYRYDARSSPASGIEAAYTINNLGNEIIKTKMAYANYFGFRDVSYQMQKDYYYGSNYAFGVYLDDYKNNFQSIFLDKDNSITGTITDFWIGKGLSSGRTTLFDVTKSQLYLGVRVGTYNFNGDRNVSAIYNNAFHNRRIFLGSISLAKQRYNQTKLLLGYGRTEDIPYGYKLELVGGSEVGEFRNRAYAAIKMAGGDLFRVGYLSGYFEAGTYAKKDSLQQGVWKIGGFYYSNLARLSTYRFRQFIGFDYIGGFNRFDGYGERVFLQDNNGIRGFTTDSIHATRRASLRLETICYSPHKIWNFKTAYFLYADIAWLNYKHNNLLEGPLYYGFGLGFRIKNDKLAFKTISVRFAFYPLVPPGGAYRFLNLSGSDRLSLAGYRPSQPDFVSY